MDLELGNQYLKNFMNKDRLLKWEQHLRGKGVTHNIGHKVFNMAEINSNEGTKKTNWCGTSGCAVGELPFVFSEITFTKGPKCLKVILSDGSESEEGSVSKDVAKFFDIPTSAIEEIMYYHPKEIKNWSDVTPQIVADKILEVIKDLES